MLTLFLNLIDRLIKLVELRQSDKKQLFNDVVEPLFTQLQPVVDDYMALFRRAKVLLESSKATDDLSLAVEELRFNREQMIQARRTVVQFAKVVRKELKLPAITEFANRIERFFSSTKVHRLVWSGTRFPIRVNSSGGAVLVELFDYVSRTKLDKDILIGYINQTLKQSEGWWVSIAASYAALRVECMAPERYHARRNLSRAKH